MKKKANQKKKSSILRFSPFTKGLRVHFLLAMVFVVLSSLANYMTPQVIRVTVDSVINAEPFALPGFVQGWLEALGGRAYLRGHIVLCAAAALVFAVVAGLTNFGSQVCLAKACEGSVERVRNRLFDHIQRLPYAWHNQNQTGDIIQRCTQDVELIKNFINDQLMTILRTLLAIFISMGLMFLMNVKLSLIVLAFIPVTMLFSFVFFVLVGKKFEEADQCEGQLTALVQENLTGVRVVRAFGRERFEHDRFNKMNQKFTSLWVRLGRLLGMNWGVCDFLAGFQALVIMVVGVFFVEAGQLTQGEFLAFTAYNSMLAWPVSNLGRVLTELSKTGISSTRIFDILDAAAEQDRPNAQTPDMTGDIVFDHVSFAYGEAGEVLEDVSFTIKAGSTFGILGATGSGKSTLMHLLDRLYELPEGGGRITIGGVDVRDIRLEHLRGHIGMVLQEPFLFSKSFRESIAEGAGRADLDAVRKYARMAAIDDAIANFAQGYETPIGERGVTISGGQKQRVAIARMLMQDTPIKVFDDSLSAVDMETDLKIRRSLRENVHGTTILIAHRITTLMNADQILVLDKGRVAQLGTHQELAAQEGIYQTIYNMQRS